LIVKYAYDTEFCEDGTKIDLISIGIVCEDGREYYAENVDCDFNAVVNNNFLWKNVVPHLNTTRTDFTDPTYGDTRTVWLDRQASCVKPKWVIANEVRDFLFKSTLTRRDRRIAVIPELWAYYGAYDHVALAQLYGPMIALPDGIPMFTHDIMQIAGSSQAALPEPPQNIHNALADARWNMAVLHVLGVVT
jgi:hypothetical protein